MSDFPKDLRYRESHEWVRLEGDVATVGITSFAIEQLGDIIDVTVTKDVGDSVRAGDAAAEIESVKAASDIYAPVSGKVTEVNGELSQLVATFGKDPYKKGWLFKIKCTNPAEVKSLLDPAHYAEQVAKEAH